MEPTTTTTTHELIHDQTGEVVATGTYWGCVGASHQRTGMSHFGHKAYGGDTYTIQEIGATIRLTYRTAKKHLHDYSERTAHGANGRTIHFGKGCYMAPEEAAALLEPEQYFTQEGSAHVGLTDDGLKFLLETYDFQYNPRHK